MKRKKTAQQRPADPLTPAASALLMPHLTPSAADGIGEKRLHARIWQRIEHALQAERSVFVTVRKEDGEWISLFPMVEIKSLCTAGTGASFLLRLQPGACLPSHVHQAAEECLMLEGDLDLGNGVVLRAGDYHMAPDGLAHGVALSRTGAVIFLRSDIPAYQL